jgi:hypothetical protein
MPLLRGDDPRCREDLSILQSGYCRNTGVIAASMRNCNNR